MLVQLSIKNYALIEDLNMSFDEGFTTITGETGAGKSILLGALSLVLGKRADLSSLKDKTSKCAIEAEFAIEPYGLEAFFEKYDLDYGHQSFLRREILPSGKSRAFINDTPVTLDILSSLGDRLVDIHSQHQTLQMTENSFQFRVLDALAGNSPLLEDYKKGLQEYTSKVKALERLVSSKGQAEKELDYNRFLLQELEKALLKKGILGELESEYTELNNVESLMEYLSNAHQLLSNEQVGVLTVITQLKQLTQKLGSFGKVYDALNERMQSISIELVDLASEIEGISESIEPNPQRLEEVNAQLQTLYDLFKKHQVGSIEELIQIREGLSEKVGISLSIDTTIQQLETEVATKERELCSIGNEISQKRDKIVPQLRKRLTSIVSGLGMQAASFKIEISQTTGFRSNGLDDLIFQFSANKGSDFGELKKVASGGELSRIMLAIKAILASYEKLPTLIFDEIDTGVSGGISNKMGAIMKEMGRTMQLFSITHLPQVASKGTHQFKVYKVETENTTSTKMKRLTKEDRVKELAEMLGGKTFSDSAISHAKQLLLQS
ncbi:MAG: DNA repair protein RecN [Bacteroidota bacterium]